MKTVKERPYAIRLGVKITRNSYHIAAALAPNFMASDFTTFKSPDSY